MNVDSDGNVIVPEKCGKRVGSVFEELESGESMEKAWEKREATEAFESARSWEAEESVETPRARKVARKVARIRLRRGIEELTRGKWRGK